MTTLTTDKDAVPGAEEFPDTGIGFTLPVTLAIAGLPAVLVASPVRSTTKGSMI
ncbi:hypothetical protein ACF05T_13600 [Streptomyces lateritius]|uniref:Uncharacterized protein n=1 Tax=Streptomyces lateritius TaxID=67313 RepID=A0ABW6YBD8_9ACTN